jgi:proto-chlorophyllide reductase subunit
VIEEETGTPLDIPASASASAPVFAEGATARQAPRDGESKLIARDDKKNPLVSQFDWTADAMQRIFRVPAGFMRNKTQERIEELARERSATTIDLGLVEDGIELGKKMMAEMISTYSAPTSTTVKHNLNEVSPLTARSE